MYYSNSEGHNETNWRNNADELERSATKLENTYLADWTLVPRFPGAQQKCDGSGFIEGPTFDACEDDYARCPGCIACYEEPGEPTLDYMMRRVA